MLRPGEGIRDDIRRSERCSPIVIWKGISVPLGDPLARRRHEARLVQFALDRLGVFQIWGPNGILEPLEPDDLQGKNQRIHHNSETLRWFGLACEPCQTA